VSGLSVAQVTPYPVEDLHEVNAYVEALTGQLRDRGHDVHVIAPSRSPQRVQRTRKALRAGTAPPDGVLAVGELLPSLGRRSRVVPQLPVDIARTIEDVLSNADYDIVHVHEPWAPSASSTALRHSRALNVGTFHAPTERVLSTQVARRFVELFFGRLDARTASFHATAELVNRFFPASYRVLAPGAEIAARPRPQPGPLRIAYVAEEEQAALRLVLRALRRLPAELDWEATLLVPGGAAPVSAGGAKLRANVRVIEDGDPLPHADIVLAASSGQLPVPNLLVRALGAGAVPIAARLPVYEEVLREGDAGLLFETGDVDTLAAQIVRLSAPEERARLLEGTDPEGLRWSRVADEFEEVYTELTRRRHSPKRSNGRLDDRSLIDVDLHMHTDHSYDCATPVATLLQTAAERGLGAIAVTDHNEVSGALDAARRAKEFGIKVIVGEEVKTASQGEVIGLFISEKIPKGLTLAETIAEIKAQGGLVYVPHPFDRLHSVPDYEHLLDHIEDIDVLEVFNPRIALPAFNEEAQRFAAKYRIVGGAGSDSHVAQGLGSVRIRMRDFDGPQEFMQSLGEADIVGRPSALYYAGVQALKFLQTKAPGKALRRAARNL
jgi:glycosyltransferase involved in cell wall biosynthesis